MSLPAQMDIPYLVNSELNVTSGVTLTIEAGVVTKYNINSGLDIRGNLIVAGRPDNEVYFTSIHDDSISGDTNNDSKNTQPRTGDWKGIEIWDNARVNIEYAVIRYVLNDYFGAALAIETSNSALYHPIVRIANSILEENNYYGIRASSASLSVTKTIFRNNSGGIGASNANVFASDCTFVNLEVGINNWSDAPIVQANNNYWGHPSGPYNPTTNPAGQGVEVSDYVFYNPWLVTPRVRYSIPIEINQTISSTVESMGFTDFLLYTVTGESLLVKITPQNPTDEFRIYSRVSDFPLWDAYDEYVDQKTGNGTYEILIAPTKTGKNYFSVFGYDVADSGVDFEIIVEKVTEYVSSVSPRAAGNAGPTTTRLIGLPFVEGIRVELRADGMPSVFSSRINIYSFTELYATFDLGGVASGLYSVAVIWPDGAQVVLEDAFVVYTGIGSKLVTSLDAPDIVRSDQLYVLWIEYKNDGDADLFAPLFALRGQGQWRLSGDEPFQVGSVQLLGIDHNHSPDVLPPGSSNSIPVLLKAPSGISGELNIELLRLPAVYIPIDWNLVEEQIKPDDIDPELWEIVFTRLNKQIGSSWGEFWAVMRENARRRSMLGFNTYDIRILFYDEIEEAYDGGGAAITGRVFNSVTGVPIVNVPVIAQQVDGSDYDVIRTNEDGRFLLQYLKPGTYKLRVDGYVLDSPIQVNVSLSQDIQGMDLPVQSGGAIIGKITGVDGSSVAGASISAYSVFGDPFTAISDGHGFYKLFGLPSGSYTLTCKVDNFIPVKQAGIITDLGSVTENIDFVLEPGGIISGTVKSIDTIDTGNPIEGARVIVTGESAVSFGDLSDLGGKYSIRGLTSEIWETLVLAPGWVLTEVVTTTLIAPGNVIQDISLNSAAIISGTVSDILGNPIDGARVFAHGKLDSDIVYTDFLGSYIHNLLPGDKYTVEVSANGYVTQIITDLITTPGVVTHVDFTMVDGKDLLGFVKESDHVTPIENASIDLHGNLGNFYSTKSDASGSFYFKSLEPDIYIVKVHREDRLAHQQMIEVAKTGYVDPLIINLSSGASIRGRVLLDDGITPVYESVVRVWSDGFVLKTDITDYQGNFYIEPLPPDTYIVTTYYENMTFDPVQINISDHQDVRVNLYSGSNKLFGTVIDTMSGSPAQGVVVSITCLTPELFPDPYDEYDYKTMTDSSGSYTFDNLRNGSYLLYINSHKYAYEPIIVTFDDQTNEINEDLRLINGLFVEGFVVDEITGMGVELAYIWIQKTDGQVNYPLLFELSNDAGYYQIGGLAEGNYSINIWADGYLLYTTDLLVDSSVTGLNIHLGRSGAKIQGSVLDVSSGNPVAFMLIQIKKGDILFREYSNSEGNFSFQNVPTGQWNLDIVSPYSTEYTVN
jgi:5-hydroxyisourate hydrolase-like protein (transthyretin family)